MSHDLSQAADPRPMTPRPIAAGFVAAIAGVADERDSDLVVIGKYGDRTDRSRLLGLLARRAARSADTSVLLVRNAPPGPPRRLLAALEETAEAGRVVDWTRALAVRFDAAVELVCVVAQSLLGAVSVAAGEPERRRAEQGLRDSAKRCLDQHAAALRDAGLHVTTHAPAGAPAVEILAAAARAGADLVVLGRHGAGALSDVLLGGTAERVLCESDRSVLLLPGSRRP